MLSLSQSFIYKAALIFLLLYVIYLFVFKGKKTNKLVYLLIIALLTFLVKLPFFFIGELNPDEAEWITIVKIWNKDFNPYVNSDPHTSGILALIPLYLFDKLFPLDYSVIRVIGTCLNLITIYLTYRILLPHLRENRKLMFLALTVLYCVLNVSAERDFIAYNTEHLCILVFVALVYVLQKMGILFNSRAENAIGKQSLSLLFIAGLLIGSSLFIKIQNLPVIFVLFCLTSFHFLKNKNYKNLVFLILFCSLPVVILLLTFLLNGSLNDFYVRYILTNLNYTSRGLNFAFIDLQVFEPFRFKITNIYPFLIVMSLAFFLVLTNLKKLNQAGLNPTLYFFLLILLVTIYEIIKPQTYLQHYYLLLYQPLVILFVWFKNFEVKKSILLAVLVLQFLYFWVFRVKDQYVFIGLSPEKIEYAKITSDIKSKASLYKCDENDIITWGWNSRFYVYGEFVPVIRDFVNVHLFVHKDYLENYYLNSFIADIRKNDHKRILVIDDLQRQKRFKLYKFPEFLHRYNLSRHFRKLTMVEHNEQYDTYVLELY